MGSTEDLVDRWMDGSKEERIGEWSGWMGREITWKLHFPLELLLAAPFGSSVGKPDLREAEAAELAGRSSTQRLLFSPDLDPEGVPQT